MVRECVAVMPAYGRSAHSRFFADGRHTFHDMVSYSGSTPLISSILFPMKYFIPLILCAACTSPTTPAQVSQIDTAMVTTPTVTLPFPNASTPREHARNMCDTNDVYTIVFEPGYPHLLLDSAGVIIKELTH